MLLGALLDAGLPLDELKADLAALAVSDYDVTLTRRTSHGITGSHFSVVEYAHKQPVRNLAAVREIIEGSKLSARVVASSLRIFERLARAEAKVHGVPVEEVHFHELSAVDSLVDIVGFCCALDRLEIEQVYSSSLPLGNGAIMTQHGLLPVPAPATLELLAEAEAPTRSTEAQGELLTPTGAALITFFATFAIPSMRIQRAGYGFGSKEFPWANMLRVWIGEPVSDVCLVTPHQHERNECDHTLDHHHVSSSSLLCNEDSHHHEHYPDHDHSYSHSEEHSHETHSH